MFLLVTMKVDFWQETGGAQSNRENAWHNLFVYAVGEQVSKCKVFLLTTAKFCKNNDSVLQNSLNGVAVWSIMPKIDGRGKAQSTKKVSYELSCSPVEPFNSIISHLKHEHAPNPMLPCPSKKT